MVCIFIKLRNSLSPQEVRIKYMQNFNMTFIKKNDELDFTDLQ